MTNNRRTCFVYLAGLLLSAVCSLPASVQAAGNWEYVADLHGWLDWDTGLVWGDTQAISDKWGPCRWDFTATTFLKQHRIDTGISSWRMATVAELQTIATNEGWRFLYPNLDPTTGSRHAFSSETPPKKKTKDAYLVNLVTGGVFVYPKTTYVLPQPVYRLFTP